MKFCAMLKDCDFIRSIQQHFDMIPQHIIMWYNLTKTSFTVVSGKNSFVFSQKLQSSFRCSSFRFKLTFKFFSQERGSVDSWSFWDASVSTVQAFKEPTRHTRQPGVQGDISIRKIHGVCRSISVDTLTTEWASTQPCSSRILLTSSIYVPLTSARLTGAGAHTVNLGGTADLAGTKVSTSAYTAPTWLWRERFRKQWRVPTDQRDIEISLCSVGHWDRLYYITSLMFS